MGGHSAWRKRVANNGLAKQNGGGAIMRHRPHRGRKGPDLAYNRKGNLGGRPNPKKVRRSNKQQHERSPSGCSTRLILPRIVPLVAAVVWLLFVVVVALLLLFGNIRGLDE